MMPVADHCGLPNCEGHAHLVQVSVVGPASLGVKADSPAVAAAATVRIAVVACDMQEKYDVQ